jgi:hypothetical protein
MEKIRAFTGELKVLETANPKLYAVEIMALNSEVNRNNWQYINLERHLNEFLDIPILTAYVGGGMIVGDGHNYAMKRDPNTGEEYASFTSSDAERIVGWIPKDQSNVRLEVVDGTEWVIVKGNLWAWYAKELVDQIARQGSMEVSIETLVTDERKGEDGVDIEEKYIVLGITILGNGVEPAVAGANIKTLSELSELRSNMAENILKAASYAKPNDIQEEDEPEDESDEDEPDEPDDEPSEESPKDNETKGVKKSMTYFTRKELAELGKKFPDYKVLAAVQTEAGDIRVCLMAKDANTSVYKMDSIDETIVPEKFRRSTTKVNFDIGEDCDNAEVDTCEVIDSLSAELADACNNASDLEQKLNAANERIKAMETAERARRVQAAKDKAHAVLASLNANRAAKAQFEDAILNSVISDIDAGKYTERVNSDGLWVGDAEVERDVSFLCMNEQKEMDRKAKEAAETTFAYNKFLNDKGDQPDSIEGLLSNLDKII